MRGIRLHPFGKGDDDPKPSKADRELADRVRPHLDALESLVNGDKGAEVERILRDGVAAGDAKAAEALRALEDLRDHLGDFDI